MAKTTAMRMVELLVLKQDIQSVLKYLGEEGDFQFQTDLDSISSTKANPLADTYNALEKIRAELNIPAPLAYKGELLLPTEEDQKEADSLIFKAESLSKRLLTLGNEKQRLQNAYTEALAFANLKTSYSELESLSFLTMRIGTIDEDDFDSLKDALGDRAVLVRLGNTSNNVLAACAKKARFFMDGELKKFNFTSLDIPKDFTGIPDEMIDSLKTSLEEAENNLSEVEEEHKNFAETHKEKLLTLLQAFSLASQISEVENKLECTEFVYRLSGWIPAYKCHDMMKHIDNMTLGRTAIREFSPSEVQSVINGTEKVPVKLHHGKIISNFERMIFSYGSPLYGTIDPTPFVAIFFTILFGIMFGDAGQGLVFLLIGILMQKKLFKLDGWEKFGIVFISIGITSTIMGLLTGEFFANAEILRPFSRWVTGLFGQSRDQILPMMPSSDPASIKRMFLFFGFTVAIGFIINTTGLIINIANQFMLKRYGRAIFGKTGITGALFFWYVIFFALNVLLLGHKPAWYDWTIILSTLLLTAFGEPLERLVDGKKPVLENGLFSAIISAVVEIIEVISSYLSNTVSFLRVGAFALAHAVLGFIIEMMMGITPVAGSVVIAIIGNAIVIVLEGMIVAIQVIRLQYYEFFSKFFSETGREFKPFSFSYKNENSVRG